MENKNRDKGLNVLVCGSTHLNDPALVIDNLEKVWIASNGHIKTLTVSNFSGCHKFAAHWLEMKNSELPKDKQINLKFFDYEAFNDPKNKSMYEELKVPAYAMKNEPFYQNGRDEILSHGINLVLAFPNQDGELGPSTRNVIMFSKMAGVERIFDFSELYSNILKQANEIKKDLSEKPTKDEPQLINRNPFVNKHKIKP